METPKVLLLDAVGRPCRIGLAEGDCPIEVETLDDARRHARDLGMAVRRSLADQNWRIEDVRLIAVAIGPGSFTGIRVAVAYAKSISYVTGCAVVGVDAFDLAVAPFTGMGEPVRVLVDYQLGSRLSVVYERQGDCWQRGPVQTWDGRPGTESAWTGPGLSKLTSPPSVTILGAAPWTPRLDDLYAIAVERWRAGKSDDVWRLEPYYVRPSSAEVTWDARTV